MPIKKPVKKVVKTEGKIDVSITIVRNKEIESVEQKHKRIQIRPFVTDVATVSVKLGTTINLGDFSSARVDVMFSVPCYVEEMLNVYEQTKEIVSDLITKEVDKITEGVE